MKTDRRWLKRLWSVVLLMTALAAGGAVVSPEVAHAAGTPAISISPATGLADGQFVKVTMSGYPGQVPVGFRQCIASAVTVATDCTGLTVAQTDSTGSGTTYLAVYSDGDQALRSAGGTGSITCDATHACVIAAVRTVADLSTAVYATLGFAPSPAACPAPGAGSILGGGSATAYRAIYGWEASVCQAPANLPVGYTVSNSVDGIANMFSGSTNFAVTGPLPSSAIPAPTNGLTYKFAPVTTSGLVLAYRIYDRRGPQITSLTLTPDAIARIFLGRVPNWNSDSEILGLNPGILFPPQIVPFVRAEHSAETYTFTSWLAATAPSVWTAGAQTIFPLPPTWVRGVTGSAAMGRSIVDPTTVWVGQGNLGFMDSSTAAFYGLPTVQIKRADGSVSAATAQTIAKAVADETAGSNGMLSIAGSYNDSSAYPMPIVSYLVAPTNTIPPAKGAVLSAFLKYAVQAGQTTLPPGYSALPANLVSASLAVAHAIPVPAPPTPTPSPTPTPAHSTNPGSVPLSTTAGAGFGSGLSSGLGTSPSALSGFGGSSSFAASHHTILPNALAVRAATPAATAQSTSGTAHAAANAAALVTPDASRFVVPVLVGLAVLLSIAGIALQAASRLLPATPSPEPA